MRPGCLPPPRSHDPKMVVPTLRLHQQKADGQAGGRCSRGLCCSCLLHSGPVPSSPLCCSLGAASLPSRLFPVSQAWSQPLWLWCLLTELSLITLHWFLTAFASVVHIRLLLRIWDLFFYEGSLVLFQTTLGMLRLKVLAGSPAPWSGPPSFQTENRKACTKYSSLGTLLWGDTEITEPSS